MASGKIWIASLGVVACLLAAVAWWLFGAGSGPALIDTDATPPAVPRAVEGAPVAESPAPERTETEAAPAAAEASPIPSSYLAALGGLTGRVVEEDRTPVAGLPVSIVEAQITQWLMEPATLLADEVATPPLEIARTTTDEDGRFHLRGLEPRAFHALGLDLGGPRSTFRLLDQSPVSGETHDLGDIILEPFVTFLGRVLDEAGHPVANARVRAANIPALVFQFGVQDLRRGSGVLGAMDGGGDLDEKRFVDIPATVWNFEALLPVPTTYSDERGEFVLAGVPTGLASVVADKAGFLSAVRPSVPTGRRPERKIGDLYLRRGARLTGTVINVNGLPLAGAEVKAGIRSPTMPVPIWFMQPAGSTDRDGRFAIEGLPDGPEAYVVVRRHAGEPWSIHGPFLDTNAHLDISFEVEEQLLVHLVHENGEAVPEAELFVAPDRGIPFLPPALSPPMQRLQNTQVLEPGLIKVGGIAPGKYKIVGRAPGLALTGEEVVIDPETPAEVTLKFRAAHTLEVSVVKAGDDTPLEWAFVTIAPKGFFEQPTDRGRTDEHGKVRLEPLEEGEYQLSVQHPARASETLTLQVPAEPLTVALGEGGHLKGRVHDGGAPPPEAVFLLAFPDGSGFDPTASLITTVTTEEGDFTVPNLKVGEYGYQVRDRVVGKGPLSLILTMQDDPQAEGQFEIFEGETTTLDIDISGVGDGPSATLTGEVWINGEARPELTVRFEGDKNRTVETDDSGRFDFGAVPAGEARLSVQDVKSGSFFALASRLHSERLELQPGEVRHLPIRLEVINVYGRVRGPGVLPAGVGTFVILQRDGDDSTQFTTPNLLTGGFEIENVSPGTYDLMVRKEGAAPYTQTLEIVAGGGDVEVDVQLHESTFARGVVSFPEGFPIGADADDGGGDGERRRRRGPPGSWLMLVDASDRPSGRARLDPETNEFAVEDAAPGTFRLRYQQGRRTLESVEFEIPPQGVEGLALSLQPPRPAARPEATAEGAEDSSR